jgi:hypothetical protein
MDGEGEGDDGIILLVTKNADLGTFRRKRDHSHSASSRLKANGTGNELSENGRLGGVPNGNENWVGNTIIQG